MSFCWIPILWVASKIHVIMTGHLVEI